MADVTIRFQAQSDRAQKEIGQLRSDVKGLKEQLDQSRGASNRAAEGVDKFGDEAAEASIGVTNLGRQVFKTSEEARKFGGVFQDSAGKIRDANGQFAKTKETVVGLGNGFGGASKNSDILFGSLGKIKGALGVIGFVTATQQLVDFAKGSADAAIQVDAHTKALTVLTGSASLARQELEAIRDLSDEPGLTFNQAIKGAVSLRAIDVDPDTTARILREIGNAAAFSGGPGEFERGLLGLRQIIQRGRISQEELNQLTENIGLASKVIKGFYGTVLAEDIQAHLDANGESVEDFVETILTEFEKLERFPLDAASVKLKNLSNSFFELQAAIGEKFLPVLASGADGLTAFFDALADYIENTDTAKESTDAFREGLEAANTEADKRTPIQNRIEDLKGFITELETAGDKSANFLSFRGEETEAGALLRAYREELALLQGALDGTTSSTEDLVAEETRLETELAAVRDRLSDVNEEISNTDPRALAREKSGLRDEVQKLKDEEAELATKLSLVKSLLETTITPLADFETKTRDLETASVTYKDTLGELHPVITAVRDALDPLSVTADQVETVFRAMDTAVHDTDVEMQALSATAESADEIFQNSTGLVREWNKEWANSKIAIISVKEALDGVKLPIDDITPPTLQIPGLDSPLEKIIEQSNAVNVLKTEVTDLAGSFDALRESTQAAEPSLDTLESKFDAIQTSVDGLPEGVSDFQDTLQLLSDNAPTILSGLFTVLGDLDSRFSGIGKTVGAIGSNDPVGFLASIPGLQQSVQSLLAPLDESDASVQQRVALSVRQDIASSNLSEADKASLLTTIDNFIREITIRYIRSLPEAFANATIAQQTASLTGQGFDFDYDRDLAALQRLGVSFTGFGELFQGSATIDIGSILETLEKLEQIASGGRAGGSAPGKKRRDLAEQPVIDEGEGPVAAAPSAPGVVQQTPETHIQATEAMVTIENLEHAGLDAAATLLNESALALSQAASDHSLAAGAHIEAASAIVAAANQLGAQGGGNFRFTLELPDGAIRDIGNNIIEQQADGRLVPFGAEG